MDITSSDPISPLSSCPSGNGIVSMTGGSDGYFVGTNEGGTVMYLPNVHTKNNSPQRFRVVTTNPLESAVDDHTPPGGVAYGVETRKGFKSKLLKKKTSKLSTYGKIVAIEEIAEGVLLLLPDPSPCPIIACLPNRTQTTTGRGGSCLPFPTSDNLAKVNVMKAMRKEVLVTGDDCGNVRLWTVDCKVREGQGRFGWDEEEESDACGNGGFIERGEDRRKEIESPYYLQFRAHVGPVLDVEFIGGKGGGDYFSAEKNDPNEGEIEDLGGDDNFLSLASLREAAKEEENISSEEKGLKTALTRAGDSGFSLILTAGIDRSIRVWSYDIFAGKSPGRGPAFKVHPVRELVVGAGGVRSLSGWCHGLEDRKTGVSYGKGGGGICAGMESGTIYFWGGDGCISDWSLRGVVNHTSESIEMVTYVATKASNVEDEKIEDLCLAGDSEGVVRVYRPNLHVPQKSTIGLVSIAESKVLGSTVSIDFDDLLSTVTVTGSGGEIHQWATEDLPRDMPEVPSVYDDEGERVEAVASDREAATKRHAEKEDLEQFLEFAKERKVKTVSQMKKGGEGSKGDGLGGRISPTRYLLDEVKRGGVRGEGGAVARTEAEADGANVEDGSFTEDIGDRKLHGESEGSRGLEEEGNCFERVHESDESSWVEVEKPRTQLPIQQQQSYRHQDTMGDKGPKQDSRVDTDRKESLKAASDYTKPHPLSKPVLNSSLYYQETVREAAMQEFDPADVPIDTEHDEIARKLASKLSVNVDPKENIYGALQEIGGDENDSAYFERKKVGKVVDRRWLRAKESCAPTASDLIPEFAEPEVRLRNNVAAKGSKLGNEHAELKLSGMISSPEDRLGNQRHVARGVGVM